MRLWIATCVVVFVTGGRGEAADAGLYPLTRQQALDPATLDPQILSDRTVDSRTHPGQSIRWVKVQFFSHDWKDGPWRATMTVAMPPSIRADRLGMAAITVAGVARKGTDSDFDVKRDLVEATALQFGIPVATMPQQGTHFGISEIHELSDHLTRKFVNSGDPSWLSAFCGAAVRARAVTMLGQLAGKPMHSVVHMGGSITAGQAWVWAVFDSRVKGLVASGSIGPFTKVYSKRPLRDRLRFLTEAPDEIRQLFIQHRDPINYARRLDCRVLIATGSNDFACPPAVMPEFLAAFREPTCLATVPNGRHSPGTHRQADTFRMWIDHTLFERPLSRVTIEHMSFRDGRLECRARIQGKPAVRRVRLWWAASNNPDFLAGPNATTDSRDNYTRAKWKPLAMANDGATWTTSVEIPEPRPRYTACFVDVLDEFAGRPGHVTSLVRQLPVAGSDVVNQLAQMLSKYPRADADGDGSLRPAEAGDYLLRQFQRKRPNRGPGIRDRSLIAAYESRTHQSLPYRLLPPPRIEPKQRYPLIISLHGSGGIGDDNRSNLRFWNGIMARPEWRKKYPAVVLVPQRRPGGIWGPKPDDARVADFYVRNDLPAVLDLITEIKREFPIDASRIYVIGSSGGAMGTWNILRARADMFAAAIPVCGRYEPQPEDAAALTGIPLWCFHGDADPLIDVKHSRQAFARLSAAGAVIKYTELRGVKHNAWIPAFTYRGDDPNRGYVTRISNDRCDPTADVWDWLFAQRQR